MLASLVPQFRCLRALLIPPYAALWALSVIAGCGSDPHGLGGIVPVEGTVLVNGKPLRLPPNAFARVWFHPDSAAGNNSPHVPAADVAPDGRFRLQTRGADGAPPGWYKVMLVATENVDPNNPKRKRRSFVHPRFGDATTSGLRLRVAADAPAGAYDLRLKP